MCRADPNNAGLEEADERSGGRAGIKLHPRAEHLGWRPAVRRIFTFAQDLRLRSSCMPVAGILRLAGTRWICARACPSVPIILAHTAISDLAWIWRDAAGQRNLFFDTAWWNTADQLACSR